jgi:hypothetical protein
MFRSTLTWLEASGKKRKRKTSKIVPKKSNATYHHFVLSKLIWLLKSSLDQNPIMTFHKFNGDCNRHINGMETKRGQMDDM